MSSYACLDRLADRPGLFELHSSASELPHYFLVSAQGLMEKENTVVIGSSSTNSDNDPNSLEDQPITAPC